MLERDMRLVALTGGRYHAGLAELHRLARILQRARDAGLAGLPSVSINHVTLTRTTSAPTAPF